ncbi:MAG: OB-fold nucleic acid binding domain-containing protein, partial [Candidatus Geothermincolia bacterium]
NIGAYDSLGYTRNHLLKIYDAALDIAVAKRRMADEGQFSLFDSSSHPDIDAVLPSGMMLEELPRDRFLAYEKEMLGVYVTDHPLMDVKGQLRRHIECDTVQLRELSDGNVRWTGGLISKVTKKLTKKGDTMAVLLLEDLVGSVEVVVFPALYARYVDQLTEDNIVCIRGRIDVKEDEVKMVATEVTCPDLADVSTRPLILRMRADRFGGELAEHLKDVLQEHPGTNPVILHIADGARTTVMRLGDGFCVDPCSHLLAELRTFLGENAVGGA